MKRVHIYGRPPFVMCVEALRIGLPVAIPRVGVRVNRLVLVSELAVLSEGFVQ